MLDNQTIIEKLTLNKSPESSSTETLAKPVTKEIINNLGLHTSASETLFVSSLLSSVFSSCFRYQISSTVLLLI